MAWRPHPRRARTDPGHPQAWGTCQRCGFIGNLVDLAYQFDWRGTQLANLQIKVCSDCYDTPQRQLGAVILPPDPVPVYRALPEPYQIDEYWPRCLENGAPRYMEDGRTQRTLEYNNAYENI